MLIGEKLTKLRKQEGWSQAELGEKLNTSRQTISKWELNDSLPDAENIVKICDLFNITTDSLLRDTEPQKNEDTISPNNENKDEDKTSVDNKKYYIVHAILLVLLGVVAIGTVNVFAYRRNTLYYGDDPFPFKAYVSNFGLDWIIHLAVTSVVSGITVTIRDLFIYKNKKMAKLDEKTLKKFILLAIGLIIVANIFVWYYFEF